MSKIIAVVGAPGSGKTTVAFKVAQEIYCGTSDNRVIFLSPNSLVPSIALLFPNYSPDELYSLGKLFDSTDICTEDVLKSSVVTKTMKNFLCLGPDFARDILTQGGLDDKKCCLACGNCSRLMRAGTVAGCVPLDGETYNPYFKEHCV